MNLLCDLIVTGAQQTKPANSIRHEKVSGFGWMESGYPIDQIIHFSAWIHE